MAENTTTLKLKIMDLDHFKEILDALGAWATEASQKHDRTEVEEALLKSAMELARGEN